ncbi:hypothetical protein N0V93_001021 [Gnomoniopsis smithogilvyi]|uniref:Uncharacterized protein n=1 Tax=Gnomoniopsis smithogilvyi TaxID=1191159 RepID=A0A9W9D1V5_9PEZI|nr:hypothetical protein N0V93_001021 [Gnomoniopsis smithogilvyi]
MAGNFTAAAFNNVAVDTAVNPTAYGHHHGPIPNPNADWEPDANRRCQITARINGDAPNPGSEMSSINTGVCDIDLGGGVMCGTTCDNQPSLRRHIRNAHPGAVINRDRGNVDIAENTAGQNAIKLFVRSGAWRLAQYHKEPGRGPINGLVNRYADAMEAIARTDNAFAQAYGTRFHRAMEIEAPTSSKRKRPPPPPPSSSESGSEDELAGSKKRGAQVAKLLRSSGRGRGKARMTRKKAAAAK